MGKIEEDASFVVRSRHRVRVLNVLSERNAIPAGIKNETGQEYSRITEALSSLEERGLVRLLVDEDTKRGRLYGVTDRGEDVYEYLRENGMM
ncbi:MAG: DNA-binding MarR family transcriptional regulator [Methanobacteriota archaeon]|jgi:DNA-binding MarR family transcriptional regulator|uniref:Winged helix DNA-binding protein n=1 Tax=Halorutilus salinus TaxID=2487751 RepID=A0A9Q4GHH9_9EURY|nr:winged helix DNA-binding protein [Halorutilus salinus]MCX2819907.1 winged helix DNA-binding protein [Halorutilus salinus]